MNKRLVIGGLTIADLESIIYLDEHPVSLDWWVPSTSSATLSQIQSNQIEFIQKSLVEEPTHLLNEATIWARAIYPLLMLAETPMIRARAEVPLSATFTYFEISGIADGVLGRAAGGRLVAPYLVVLEAKRGTEAVDPVPQLYGQMLAASLINWQESPQATQQMFGCYTIADTWTFVRSELSGMDSERLRLRVETSREYSEKLEAAKILTILQRIVATKED